MNDQKTKIISFYSSKFKSKFIILAKYDMVFNIVLNPSYEHKLFANSIFKFSILK